MKRIAKSIKAAVKRVIGDELIGAFRLQCLRWRAWLTPMRAKSSTPHYVQVGSGGRVVADFLNLDLVAIRGAIRADISHRIPLQDQSVCGMFAEHVFEHLECPRDTSRFLSECRRVLLPGQLIRVVVPDAGAYLRAYAHDDWQQLSKMRPLDERQRDHWLGDQYRTRMELINAVFRQRGEHRYAYDAETLIMVLQDAGLVDVRQCAYGEGDDPKLLIDSPERASESLYVEARNPSRGFD